MTDISSAFSQSRFDVLRCKNDTVYRKLDVSGISLPLGVVEEEGEPMGFRLISCHRAVVLQLKVKPKSKDVLLNTMQSVASLFDFGIVPTSHSIDQSVALDGGKHDPRFWLGSLAPQRWIYAGPPQPDDRYKKAILNTKKSKLPEPTWQFVKGMIRESPYRRHLATYWLATLDQVGFISSGKGPIKRRLHRRYIKRLAAAP